MSAPAGFIHTLQDFRNFLEIFAGSHGLHYRILYPKPGQASSVLFRAQLYARTHTETISEVSPAS
jgi:hypothetical protein